MADDLANRIQILRYRYTCNLNDDENTKLADLTLTFKLKASHLFVLPPLS